MQRAFTTEIASFTGEFFFHGNRIRPASPSCSFFSLFRRRTNSDILELSEISLDLNLVNNNIRYKFTDSPILAVSIAEVDENLIVLVATVSSIHHLKFSSPNRMHKSNDETQSFSVFHEAATQLSRDPTASLFYVIGHAATPSTFPLSVSGKHKNRF